ncbi:MAG: hypothetical protein ABI165_20780 [Bryobacteraceae bacterium]
MPRIDARTLAIAALAPAMAACGFALCDQAIVTERGGASSLPGMEYEDWRGCARMLTEFGRNSPKDAVLAGILDPMYYLYSGRKALRPFSEDPYPLYYSDAPLRTPIGGSARFIETLRANRVSYVVADRLRLFGESKWIDLLTDEIRARYPESLSLVTETADARFRIYRIEWNRVGQH